MTGMLLEIHKKVSIVLGSDGQIYKIKKTPRDTVGKTIKLSVKQIGSVKRKRLMWKVASRCLAFAVVVLVLLVVGVAYQLFQTFSKEALTQIDIESQGSLYVTVDRDYIVVLVEAKDENGRKMLEYLELRGLPMETALEKIFQAEYSEGATNAAIAVTSSHVQSHIENLTIYQKLSSVFDNIGLFYIQPEQWDSCIGQDISPAKVALLESILSDDTVDSQEWVSRSVQDIWEGLTQSPSKQQYDQQQYKKQQCEQQYEKHPEEYQG